MECTQNNEYAAQAKPLLLALETFAVLFARPTDKDYQRTVKPAAWDQTIVDLQCAGLATNGIAQPPAAADYRLFANRVLTSGFPTSALPVESLYKHWDDKSQTSFSHCEGYFDGAPASHVRYLCETWGLSIPDEFRAMPDHLSILLEILAALYEQGAMQQAAQFAADHLDWLSNYDQHLAKLEPLLDPGSLRALHFYRAMTNIVHTVAATLVDAQPALAS